MAAKTSLFLHTLPSSQSLKPLALSPLLVVDSLVMVLSLSLSLQSSLAQLGIPLTDVLKVLSAVLLLGNTLFYEAKNQELQLQGMDGRLQRSPLPHRLFLFPSPHRAAGGG